MSMNTLNLSNVSIDERLQVELTKQNLALNGVMAMIDPVVSRLASLNPLWNFVVTSTTYNNGNGRLAADFRVMLDSEELGHIGTSYMGQKGRVICITNDRIGNNRQRSSSYRTSDADKAVLMAKKMFGKMNPNERIKKAHDEAERVVTRASWNKERERSNYQGIVKSELIQWAEGKGFALFMDYLKTEGVPHIKQKVDNAREKVAALNIEMKTIERVQKDFADRSTALVVKDSGKYLVKTKDKVDMYDDNDLPLDMRMKLGMLKLVEDEQYLTDVGCRVTNEIFVLLVDDLTNVSEGV